MLNGLLITYYFHPCNNVASLRPYSWFNNFQELGINLTVITRHWEGTEKNAIDFHQSVNKQKEIVAVNNSSIHYLPFQNTSVYSKKFPPRIQQMKDILEFVFDSREIKDLHNSFYNECIDVIKHKKIDFIIVTAGPFSLFPLAYQLNKEFNIPYIVDFRDLWSLSEHTRQKTKIGFLTKVQNYLLRKRIGKWISNSIGVISVNDDLGKHLLKRLNHVDKKYFSVYNGYEETLFDNVVRSQKHIFTFSVIGTIYPEQNIQIAIDSIILFLEKYSSNEDFQFNFIGTAVYPELKHKIQSQLNSDYVRLTDRLPREQALSIMANSNVLFHCGWPSHIGISSGKIYEYIAAGPAVLIAPNDFGVMEKIISETGTGFTANSSNDMFNILENLYQLHKKSLPNGLNRDEVKIAEYTRENQAKLLASKIKEWIN